ncbi:myomesin-3 isoform 1-T1 [Synchiropus picturatus]
METRSVTQREQKETSSRMSHSMQLSSYIKKKTFTSSDEEASFSDLFPIIPADVMSVKETLDMDKIPRHRTWEVLQETLASEAEYRRCKWTLFGNEAEKLEMDVMRNQHLLLTHFDNKSLRTKAEKKAFEYKQFLELLRQKAPDFVIPLRAHTVWEGMRVMLACTVQGCPPPKVTWYKDGVAIKSSWKPWNYGLQQKYGVHTLEIRRCSPVDAGEYKVVLKSPLGEATSYATLVVNSYHGAITGSGSLQTPGSRPEDEAQFATRLLPTWVTEGNSLTLQCTFTSPLLPYQQEVSWFRDGLQLHQSSMVNIETTDDMTTITLSAVYKEHEGVYTVRLKTWDGTEESSAYVYVRDASAAVAGGPASPLNVQVSDIHKDYVFLTWQPPSADGASHVLGYYVERCDLVDGQWLRCNEQIQKACHYPVFGLKEGAAYRFRVCAVNQAGTGRPSKATEPIVTADPMEESRTMVVMVSGRPIVVSKDEMEGHVTIPFPPTNVHASEVTDTYVVMSWTEPDPRGREPLTYYVERCLAGTNSWELATLDMVLNSPRFPVFDLLKGKKYLFRVRSVNKYGVSDPSEPSVAVSLGKPQAPPAPPHSIMAFRDTDTSVLLKWQEPKDKDDVLGYYIYYSEAGKQDWNTVNNKPIVDNKFVVHGLKTRKEYVFRIKSVSRAGNSVYSGETQPILVKAAIRVPSPPSAIALLLCTGSEMVVGWRAPASNGGAAVRGYYLDQKERDAEVWREVNIKPVKERRTKISNLTGGCFYQFRVFATNMVGVGKPSAPSDAFLCEKWTMPEPGCPFDLQVREVRSDSLVLLWEAPLYEGRGPIQGYFLEVSTGHDSNHWAALNESPVTETHFKVSGLQEGQTYRFRVSAVNEAGVGSPSLPSESVTAGTQPGSKDIEIGVDNKGFIYLAYECEGMDEDSQFLWNKNYKDPIDPSRAREETSKDRSTLTFNDASEEDLGLYTVEISDNPELSSSYDFTAEDLERLKELSNQVRNPLIELKSGWQVEVSEEGKVRLWLQTESLSESAELRVIFNDKEISSTPRRKINFDKAKGLVEILIDPLSVEDEGSYTAQLRDGRAKNQSTLVFVDQKFRDTLALANARRREHQRKSGPYFDEFLSWSVSEDCEVILKCKVTNTNKETTLKWFKDSKEVTQIVYDQKSGVSSFTISKITKKDEGSYKAVVSDKRGEDVSTLKLKDGELDKLLQQLSKQCALSAGPLTVQGTAEGLKLSCSLKYYIINLKTSWFFKEKKINQDSRMKPGSSSQSLWIEILDPTEKDKGKYTLEMFDGKETHKRSLDLSGQIFDDAMLEYQRLKQEALINKRRAKVTKGLPDVVAIMEGKSLCLTCFIEGDPNPEITWFRNDKEILNEDQFVITKEPKCSTITINDVNTENSGKYSIFVQNKHGSETEDVTVSVYKHGEMPPAHAVEMS